MDKETMIRRYFDAWLRIDGTILPEVFAEDVVYSECYGPEYHGLAQIERWFKEWNMHGRMLQWTIKRILCAGNTCTVEWYFECDYDGIAGFDGVSLVDFNTDGKIQKLAEFQSESKHTFPYGESF